MPLWNARITRPCNVKDPKKKELLERYVDNEFSSELNEVIQGWMINGEDEKEKERLSVELVRERYKHCKPTRRDYLNLRKLHERLGFGSKVKVRMPLYFRASFRVAAVLLPFLVLTGSLFLNLREIPDTIPPTVVIALENGESDYRILPDGSKVWINEGSRISYNEDFEQDRTITLEGEAYFSVVHTADNAPFTVTSDAMTVRVLGTEFNVKAYAGDSVVAVTLATGSLEVENSEKQTVRLEPDMQAVIDRATAQMHTRTVTREEVDWSPSGRAFEGATVRDVLKYIAVHYKVVFVGQERPDTDPTVRIKFKGTESLEDALYALQFITNHIFDYRIEGDTVYILPSDQ